MIATSSISIINVNDGTSIAISSKSVTYQKGTSGTVAPTGGWTATIPELSTGEFLWTKTVVNYTDGNSTTAYSVAYRGYDGDTPTVTDTTTLYQQSTSGTTVPSGEWVNTPPTAVDGQYMWTQTTVTYSNNAESVSYSVSKNGTSGFNNATVYLYKRALSSPAQPSNTVTYTFLTGNLTGTLDGWTQNIPQGTDPIWITLATASSIENTDTILASEWTNPVILSENGTDGYNQATIYLYQRASQTPAKPSTELTYTFATNSLSTVPSGWSRNIPTADGNPCYVTTATAYGQGTTDTISSTDWSDVVKLADDGMDGYTIFLTNDSYTFAGNTISAEPGSTECGVIVYKGDTQLPATIGTISGQPTGLTTSVSNNGTTTAKFTVTVTSSMVTQSGFLDIPITVEGKLFNKRFTYALALKGIDGSSSQWYTGTGITGTSSSALVFINSGVADAKTGDMYLNTSTYDTYKCVSPGNAGTATWTYVTNIKGGKGDKGDNGVAYHLITSQSAIVKKPSGDYSPTQITLTAKAQSGESGMADYSGRFKIETTANNSTWTVRYTSSANEHTYTYSIPVSVIAIRCSLYFAGGTTTLLDQQTIPVISDGMDAYTVLLSNENHTFAGNTTSAYPASTDCDIIIYKGATPLPVTIGTITGDVPGLTTTVTNNETTTPKITITVSSLMNTPSGVLTIPLTADGHNFTKRFTYSLNLKGADGITPPTIISESEEWYLSNSNSQATGGNWSETEPTSIPSNKYLWGRWKFTMSDGSIIYSDAVYRSTLSGVISRVNTVEGNITNKIWQTDINTSISSYDNTTVKSIRDRVTSTEADISGLELAVGDYTQIVTETDGDGNPTGYNDGANKQSISQLLSNLKITMDGITMEVNKVDMSDMFTTQEYTLFKQSASTFYNLVLSASNAESLYSIATQTADRFEWLLTTIPDGYLVDHLGRYIVDHLGNKIKTSSPRGYRLAFSQAGLKLINSSITVRGVDGTTTIVDGGIITTNKLRSQDRQSWINLGLGTFDYGGKLLWDGSRLIVKGSGEFSGRISASEGYIGSSTEGFSIYPSYIVNGNIKSAASTNAAGIYIGKDGFCISNGTPATTSYFTKTSMSIGGKLTYNGSTLTVNGTITAGSGSKIGGWTITSERIWSRTNGMTTAFQTQSGDYGGQIALAIGAEDDAKWNTARMYVLHNGTLYAKNAVVQGQITVDSGSMFGYTADSNSIYTGTKGSGTGAGNITLSSADFTRTINGTSRSGLRLAVGSNFAVKNDGTVYASNGVFSGTVYASSGSFSGSITVTDGSLAGWTINSTAIYSGTGVTSNADNAVALCSSTFTRSLSQFGSIGNLKFAIGSKFAVKNDGTLYATGGEFRGTVRATDLWATDSIILTKANYPNKKALSYYTDTTTSDHGLWIGEDFRDVLIYSPINFTAWSAHIGFPHAQSVGFGAEYEYIMCTVHHYGKYYLTDTDYGQLDIGGNLHGFNDRISNLESRVSTLESNSDIRLKSNIKSSKVDALSVINAIPMRSFDWIKDGKHQRLGVIADEIQKLDPSFVYTTKHDDLDIKAINIGNLQYYSIRAIQQLLARIEELEKEIKRRK